MIAAAVAATAMAFAMTVMVAMNSGVVSKFSCQESIYCCIGISLNATVQGNACLSQGILGTAANTAANQSVDIFLLQEGSQGTMTSTIAGNNMGFLNSIVFNGINLELFCMAEMLENLAVVVGNCKFHQAVTSFLSGKAYGMRAMMASRAEFKL